MPDKKNREIAHEGGIVYGDTTYEKGDESKLAKVCPQWNIDQMVRDGWLKGDWKDAGLDPEEEQEAIAASTSETEQSTRSRSRGNK